MDFKERLDGKVGSAFDAVHSHVEFYKTIIDRMTNAFALHKVILDDTGTPCDYVYLEVNSHFETLTGLKRENVLGKAVSELLPSLKEDKTDWIGLYGTVAMKGESISFESYSAPLDKWFLINAYSPQQQYFVTVFSDVSQFKENENRLRYLVNHDELTGLRNRLGLHEDIKKVLQNSPDSSCALLYIDVENLKSVNNTLGYSAGDKFIVEIAKRLTAFFESTYTFYRLNGGEFALLLPEHVTDDELLVCAKRVIQCFKDPIVLLFGSIHTTVSIGIVRYPEHGANSEELLRNADVARNSAKGIGRNKCTVYEPSLSRLIEKRTTMERELYSALGNNEFELYYQPQLDLSTKKITGFEALIRWKNPKLGLVSPAEFISIAEFNHLIIPIGAWVIRNACFFAKRLHAKGYFGFTVSVNVSVIQLLQDDFADSVLAILELIGLEPKYLELEITESVLLSSFDAIFAKIETLRSRGIRFALDDFGKGYSSLSNLNALPFDVLKIDKVFVDAITEREDRLCFTDMIIALGRKLGMTVLAEGVETQEQMDYLIQNQCHQMQGYLFSKPLPDSAIWDLIRETTPPEKAIPEFEWNDKYCICIKELDDQHKRMSAIGRKLAHLALSDSQDVRDDELAVVFLELKEYLKYHFEFEEALFLKNNYPFSITHIGEHHGFIAQVEKAFNDTSVDKGNHYYGYLVDMISVWITNHILKEDRRYGTYLTGHGDKPQ
ncbi:MAG: hypothetical protein CVU86_03130 [Firmicutes bacterium HGW-Firmicutes-11]|jgi:diguanylate cyclase (GGDEF)-like protein/hemerythrin-like metal-binding protein|nr:MAG: hypothetical protein CVU86_03130 [Firmicutes bacterium HGW-Firmicutes-11]